jgi:hypothetical protein
MFLHRNIHQYTWTSPDAKTHNQINHTLIERRWHLSILDIPSCRAADYDTDHYLVVAKVSERSAVSKQAAKKFHVERFNLRKLNELQVRNQYQIKISNRYAALENLNDSKDINRAWENTKENIKISAKEILGLYKLKQHNPWFDDECLHIFDQRKCVKMW